jgi:hypothetical protein
VITDKDRADIQKQIDTLTEKKRIMEVAIKPLIDSNTIEELNDRLSEHSNEVSLKPNVPETIKDELTFQQSLVKTYKAQYKAL